MRNRAFGVELEFCSNDLGENGVGDLLWNNGFQEEWVGRRREHGDYGETYYSYDGIGFDGSELEIRTPILEGAKGFKDLQKVVNLLAYEGCYTTEDDGLHVHHDAPEFIGNKPLLVKLLKSWKYNEHLIAKFIDEGRADWSLHEWDDSPCPSFSMEQVSHFEKTNTLNFSSGGWGGRNNLNINALQKHGSIELRFHHGTLDWDEIESWIRFGQSFLNGVQKRKNPMMPADSPVVLMNRLKTNEKAKRYLARKARA